MSVPPRRLLDPSVERSKEDATLARYLGAVPEPAPLPTEAVERVSRRLALAAAPTLWARLLRWALAVATPLVIAGAWALHGADLPSPAPTVLPAVAGTSRARPPEPAPTVGPEPGAPPALPPRKPSAPAAPSTQVPVKRAAPASAPAAHRPPRRHRQRKPVAAPVPPAPSPPARTVAAAPPLPPPDPLIEESRLLQSALHALRALRDGRAALLELDTYERRFPNGQLRAEATLARVDALLLLDRPAEALARLQGLAATDRARLPRSRELQVLELELLAQTGRCGEVLKRLETFRPRASEPLLDERALFVRATCEARAARVDVARALYEELLRRWPDGAHAAEARRALGAPP